MGNLSAWSHKLLCLLVMEYNPILFFVADFVAIGRGMVGGEAGSQQHLRDPEVPPGRLVGHPC